MRTILITIMVLGWTCSIGCAGQTSYIQPATTGITPDTGHALFGQVLRAHVRDGRVDYASLCADGRLPVYLSHLAATDPDAITNDLDRLAFWINAYNAFTLQVICDNYPVKSINDLHFGGLYVGTVTNKTIWDRDFIVINGNKLSLNHIEHEIIRPRFRDPRVHFALVCASKSCPALRSEAFEGQSLEHQLDEQTREFFAETEKNRFDVKNQVAHLSKILKWYAGDFGDDDTAILLFVSRYVGDGVAGTIRRDPAAWGIKHTDYDWSLND